MITAQLFDARFSSPWIRSFVLASISDLVYGDLQTRNKALRSLGLTEELFIRGNGPGGLLADTEVALFGNPELLIIAFRGSETGVKPATNLIDWLNDVTFFKTKYRGTRVHRGFVRALEAVWPILEKNVKKRSVHRKVWLTGHSLGGALAQLAGYALQKAGQAVEGVVTFGSPRVGGGQWKDDLTKMGLRPKIELWINGKDPVARLPPSRERGLGWLDVLPLWTHAGQIHFINEEQKQVRLFHNNPGKFTRPTARIQDHFMHRYLDNIRRYMPVETAAWLQSLLDGQKQLGLRALLRSVPSPGSNPVSMRQWFKALGYHESASAFHSLRFILPK